MITLYALLKSLHILLLVTWVGMDIGVFASSFWIRNSRFSPETRLQMGRLAGFLDMGPRSSLILILALGLILTHMGGWGFKAMGDAGVFGIGIAVVLCFAWLWAVWQQYFAVHDLAAGHPLGGRAFFVRGFRHIDLVLRICLALLLILLGLLPALGMPLIESAWLSWKIALFGLIILAGVGIRMVADDFPIALGEIARQGSTPERERRLDRSLVRAYPFVIGLWSMIVLIVLLAVAKPG